MSLALAVLGERLRGTPHVVGMSLYRGRLPRYPGGTPHVVGMSPNGFLARLLVFGTPHVVGMSPLSSEKYRH